MSWLRQQRRNIDIGQLFDQLFSLPARVMSAMNKYRNLSKSCAAFASGELPIADKPHNAGVACSIARVTVPAGRSALQPRSAVLCTQSGAGQAVGPALIAKGLATMITEMCVEECLKVERSIRRVGGMAPGVLLGQVVAGFSASTSDMA
jgi:hypothetical protein